MPAPNVGGSGFQHWDVGGPDPETETEQGGGDQGGSNAGGGNRGARGERSGW